MKNDHIDMERARSELLNAIKPHVPFDGWSDLAFSAAVADLGLDSDLARVICPRGAVDLAVEYHRAGDALMLERLEQADLSGMKFRDRIAAAVRFRLEVSDPELVRRGASVFALAPERDDRVQAGLGHLRQDLARVGGSKRRLQLVFQAAHAVGRLFGDCAFLDGRHK